MKTFIGRANIYIFPLRKELVSQTPEEVTLKGADAIVRSFKRSDIETLQQSPVSLMPADLHKALTVQGIADVVEYLLTLKEASKARN